MFITRKRFEEEINKAVCEAEDKIHERQRLYDIENSLHRRMNEFEKRMEKVEKRMETPISFGTTTSEPCIEIRPL